MGNLELDQLFLEREKLNGGTPKPNPNPNPNPKPEPNQVAHRRPGAQADELSRQRMAAALPY